MKSYKRTNGSYKYADKLLNNTSCYLGCFFIFLTCCFSACNYSSTDDRLLTELIQIKIDIGPDQWTLIQRKRAEAMALGLLNSSSDDFVAANIQIDSLDHLAQIRLKGDWLDHLKGNKWSWRVKLKEGNSLLGLQQFSLQHPRTRSYLQEWVFHQLLEQEGILTPKYTFVQLWLNGDNKGIYALEEHFIETLPERQQRPDAPILKFAEDGFWQTQSYRLQYGKNITPNLPDYEAADILPFQKGKVGKASGLQNQFRAAQSLLDQYRLSPESAPGKWINSDQLARFYALCDVAVAYHALRWHNMRFYYNPSTALLEPIGYDAYSENGVYRWFKAPFLGYSSPQRNKIFFAEEFLIFGPFNDPAFRKAYYTYLEQYSQTVFLNHFFEQIKPELNLLNSVLQTEFQDYHYVVEDFLDQAHLLRETLDTFDTNQPPFVYTIYKPMYEGCKTPMPLKAISLKAYPSEDSSQLVLQNYYCQPVTIHATGPKKNKPLHLLDPPVLLSPFDIHQIPPVQTSLKWPSGDRYVFYSVPGIDYWYRQPISNWLSKHAIDFIDPTNLQIDTTVFILKGQQIRLLAGEHTLSEIQLIPKGYELIIEAGSKLDLINGAAIINYGGGTLEGTKARPVLIHSSDRTGRGFHCMGSAQSLSLENVHFQNLHTFQDKGRFLNGAVSIYDRNVFISNCLFEGSQAEDALNIVRSKAYLIDLSFVDCQGDGLDADFSSGDLKNSYFSTIGGDAVDFSGSNFNLSDISFENIADKGISAGEGTLITGHRIIGNNLKIGIAAKDNANVQLDQVTLSDCEYGLVAFAKKAIYLPASLIVDQYKATASCKTLWAVEPQHTLEVNQRIIIPTHLTGTLKGIFYPPE